MRMWWAYLLSGYWWRPCNRRVDHCTGDRIMGRQYDVDPLWWRGYHFLQRDGTDRVRCSRGGIYVKYKNIGDKHATTACFRVRVFNKSGDLIAESDEAAYSDIVPGQTQENIIASHELQDEWIHDPDNKIDVLFRYGYLE